MDVIEPVKRIVEKATGIGIPSREEALGCVRDVRPSRMKFRDDGYIPNNPKFPLLYYRKALRFGRKDDSAAVLEKLFNINGWGEAWRNGIYDYVHYHSMIHEVLGIARGSATLRLGGNKGKTVKVGAGDVIVVPAGVGHECLNAGSTFLVVGAYPPTGTYNECRGSFQERDQAITAIRRVGVPKQHPLYGSRERLW
ncbi:cupin domain-containing protein [Roseiarcaceae bacterium H3SJ34-1]|jgi:uncharacterized protein YjlB|uniref:cupin domain-containing protein n=1 Tax=Hyphomicrobiales TaxID=356 RepID=UPI00070D79A8|nr:MULTISPECIES: cupin domain-containing protein [unclassified Bradyrhizobium]KQT22710.1 cupin [Bradyrhizobium sp. Leaf396]MDF2117422.1 cupin domain-containing protein [Roseiarcaceae bacterium H3SJ34-1]